MFKNKQKKKVKIAAHNAAENADCGYVGNEENISLNEFIFELKCALRQSFFGLITEDCGVIRYVMPNGQKFKIEVWSE